MSKLDFYLIVLGLGSIIHTLGNYLVEKQAREEWERDQKIYWASVIKKIKGNKL